MELCIKTFDELTLDELYDLIKLRIAVFVVEQECPYMDTDDLDQDAIHLWFEDESGIIACLRVLDRGIKSEYVSIGRVVCIKRRQGIATELLREGIRIARERFNADKIYIEAQLYARTLYEGVGFRQISDIFLEDGIEHIKMLLG